MTEPQKTSKAPPRVILITGQAGAGHSTTLKLLEDQGYVSVDNLPLSLVDQLVAIEVETQNKQLALCVDSRTSGFEPQAILRLIDNLTTKFSDEFKHVHLTASEPELIRRYQSTRRAHPLAGDYPIEQAIALDHERMDNVRAVANVIIDSTAISPMALRTALLSGLAIELAEKLSVRLISFGYKSGLPEAADYVFDTRFLRNPHWDHALRSMTGKDEDVFTYIASDQGFDILFKGLQAMVPHILERAIQDARPQLSFAFGCTGGRHRSVACAEHFAQWLKKEGHHVVMDHRELAKQPFS